MGDRVRGQAAIDAGRVPGVGRVEAAAQLGESDRIEQVRERIDNLLTVADRFDHPGGSRALARRARDKADGMETALRLLGPSVVAPAAAPASQPTDAPLVALVREYADRHAITLPSEPGPDRRVVDVDELVEWLQGRDVARDPLEGGLTVEWGVLGDVFSPQPSREKAERTVERLRTGKMRVANRHVAWRYVSAPRRTLLPDAATEGGRHE